MQVLAELGYPGELIWLSLFGFAFFACFRVRRQSREPHVDPRTAAFLRSTANALIMSMAGFVVGGSFLSLAVNDLTWLTFGIVGALDRFACRTVAVPAAAPELPTVSIVGAWTHAPTFSRGR